MDPNTPRPYQTKERLFYQPDFTPSRLTRAESMAALRDQAPTQSQMTAPLLENIPQSSLYDTVMMPEPSSPAIRTAPKEKSSAGLAMAAVEALDNEVVEVTVFGFPTGRGEAILQLFRQLGPLEAYEAGQGNWLHLHYASPWAAQRALAKNGTGCRVGGNNDGGGEMVCLLGVMPRGRAEEALAQTLLVKSTAAQMVELPNITPNPTLFTTNDEPTVQRLMRSLFGLQPHQ